MGTIRALSLPSAQRCAPQTRRPDRHARHRPMDGLPWSAQRHDARWSEGAGVRPPQLASDRATPKDGIAGGTQQNDHVRAVPNARAAGKVYLLRQWLRHFALAFWAVHRSLLLQHRFYLGATADTDRGDVTDVTDVTANTGMGEGADGRHCARCPQVLSAVAVSDLCGRCAAKAVTARRPVFNLCCDDDANAPADFRKVTA